MSARSRRSDAEGAAHVEGDPIARGARDGGPEDSGAAPDASVSAAVVGSLSFTDRIIVYEQRHGWHRIRFDGEDAWVAGWLTAGRL